MIVLLFRACVQIEGLWGPAGWVCAAGPGPTWGMGTDMGTELMTELGRVPSAPERESAPRSPLCARRPHMADGASLSSPAWWLGNYI